jgi:hypothetical protein
MQAIEKAAPFFNEVKDLPSRVFERHFRSFIFEFKPKDLRI